MKKSTLVLLLMAIGLGVFVYFYEIKGGEEREAAAEKAKRIFPFEQSDIAEISLKRAGKTLRFQKKDDTWVMTQPLHTKADQSALDAIARNLATTDVERKLAAAEEKLETYGLKTPKVSLRVKLKSGDQHRLRLGGEDFSGSNVYALIDDSQEVALVPKYLFSSADKTLFDLRNKSVINVSQSDVNSLELKTPTGRFLMVKQDDNWQLRQPRQLPADSSEVSSILSKLSFARMTEVVAEEAQDLKAYGLDKPAITARLRTGKGDEHVLMLGKKEADQYYAKTNDRSLVFKVKADVHDKLEPTLFDLRNKRPAPFDRDDITRVRLKNEHQTLICEKSKDNKWLVKQPAKNKDKEVRQYKLFSPLETSDAKEIFDEPSKDLTAKLTDPAIEIELTKKDGHTITIRISKKVGDSVYVRNSLSPAVMRFDSHLLDDLNFKLEDVLL